MICNTDRIISVAKDHLSSAKGPASDLDEVNKSWAQAKSNPIRKTWSYNLGEHVRIKIVYKIYLSFQFIFPVTFILKCGVNLLVYSQTSPVQPLKFGNG